jgi:hypothetical protein
VIFENEGHHHPAQARKPALRSDCIKYYDAYRLLGASRIWSQVGPSSIQVSEIKAYLDMLGIEDPLTKLKYMRLIQQMDRVELKHIHQRSSK